MLEAEWRQVLLGSMSMGAKEDESSTGRVWAAGFHHVTHFETYQLFISLVFQFSGLW
jgi:hypothetical protein